MKSSLLTQKNNLLLIFSILILGCGSDESSIDDSNNDTGTFAVTTNTPTDINGSSATLGGNVTSENSENNSAILRGVCWSLNTNPTTNDNFQLADGSGLGQFYVSVDGLIPNTTYNVRAFIQNNTSIEYGNNQTFTTEALLTFVMETPKNIITSRADFIATVEYNGSEAGHRGFVVSTSPNPTTNDATFEAGVGLGQYGGQIANLTPNTTYYVRPYALAGFDNEIYYGEQQSFQTAGYSGPAGGYVVYDKGEVTDGWRYIEAANTTSSFDGQWGCYNLFIPGTSSSFGSGVNNTNTIISNCSASDCAARIADSYSLNGFNDWFLPSSEEGIALVRSLSDLNAIQHMDYIWSSTQQNSQSSTTVAYDGDDDTVILGSHSKNFTMRIIPIRRY